MKTKDGYVVREKECKKRDCFVPFEGNGIKICRLYELGQCPVKYREVIPKTQTEIEMDKFDTLQKIVDQLEWCKYEAIGGPLELNIAFLKLKQLALIGG